MNADEQRKALAIAAQAAREMIEGKVQMRERLQKQVDAVTEEIARLEVVASFDGARPAKISSSTDAPVPRERKHDWVAIVTEMITQHEPDGIIYTDLVRKLKTERGHKHSNDHVKKLLERKEADGVFYRDVERRWHLKPQLTSTPMPTGISGAALTTSEVLQNAGSEA